METTPRCKALQDLAGVLDGQLKAIRTGDLNAYTASQSALEAACSRLRAWHGQPSTPAERAWAITVRRLSGSIHDLMDAMSQPFHELVRSVAAQSTGRAGPLGLDLRV